MDIYDVIVIGGGPAGLAASIYASRKKLKTLMVTVNIGGQIVLTEHIENYPGYEQISGLELSQKFEDQMKKFSAEMSFGKVQSVARSGDNFEVSLASGEKYFSKTLIMAFGKISRSLGIPGEEKFLGKGVSTCAVCDAPLYKDKVAVVIGGGNSALEGAELLSRFASKVYLVHRRDGFVGDQVTLDAVKSNPKIEMITNSTAIEIRGDKFVSSVIIENVNSHEKREMSANGVFVEIGYETKTDWIKDFVKLNELGEIIINERCETSQPGVFAAGDVANGPYKQLVIAAGQGAVAGLSAFNYLQKISGKAQMRGDWGKVK